MNAVLCALTAKYHSQENLLAFQLKALGLRAPERQFRFAYEIGRKWAADFCWPVEKLIVEIEGAIWRGGAHSHPSGILRDMAKSNDAALLGYRVLRFTSDQVKDGSAVEFIGRVLAT